MGPVPGVKLDVGRRRGVACDAEQRAEGVERVKAPVEPKREFVEVGLQMACADPVMRARQPRFEIGEDEMADRQEFFGDFGIAA